MRRTEGGGEEEREERQSRWLTRHARALPPSALPGGPRPASEDRGKTCQCLASRVSSLLIAIEAITVLLYLIKTIN